MPAEPSVAAQVTPGGWRAPGKTAAMRLATNGVVVAAAITVLALDGRNHESPLRLPDLDQEAPAQLEIKVDASKGGKKYLLGFRSAVRNVGDGPLVVQGNRIRARGAPRMVADQLVERQDGSAERVPEVGRLDFASSSDHYHWHFAGFDRYELRRAGDPRALVKDRKSGFCLGDRYLVTRDVVAGTARGPAYRGDCGKGATDLNELTEGISVGYGDDYRGFLEYQELALDGLPDGRYVLVHTVNSDGALREITRKNNAASSLFRLRWADGQPTIKVLRTCPDTDRCDRRVDVETIASGLEIPWDIGFLPGGGALVTERPGRVRLLDARDVLHREPVANIDVGTDGEGGLLGLAIDPDFATNHAVYLYYTGTDSRMHLQRWHWTGTSLVQEADLIKGIVAGRIHDSGRIGFGPDQRLYLATGDSGHGELAQDPRSLNGKMLALIPEQYRGVVPVVPTIVASGLRNTQGFDWQPGTGDLIATDHGPTGFDGPDGFDEINRIIDGGNYGWPEVISNNTAHGRFRAPLKVYVAAIAPSGGTFLRDQVSIWTGDFVFASLRGQALHRLVLERGRVVVDDPLLEQSFGRLRTVRQGPDGDLYVLTSNRDGRGEPVPSDDRILRLRLPNR